MKKFFILFICLVLTIGAFGIIYISSNWNNLSSNTANQNSSDAEEERNLNEVEYETYSYITDEVRANLYDTKPMLMMRTLYTPEYMLEKSDTIALITIVTIDGASTEYNEMFGMTYGNMIINNIIYGNDIKEKNVEYIKPGGIMTFENWEKTQPEAANEKRKYWREQSGIELDMKNTYIKFQLENDIELEAGKTYLAYLNYSDTFKKYEIIGLGNGLREVNIEPKNKVIYQKYDIDNLKIKNNNTGMWEDLNNYINENINENEKI